MFNSALQIVINAQDNATAVISGLTGKLNDMSSSFTQVAAIGTASFAAVAGAIGVSVANASNLKEAQGQLNAAMQSSGGSARISQDALDSVNKSLVANTLITPQVATAMETAIVPFKNISATVFPQVSQAAADMAARLGTDPVAAAQLLGKALDDPTQGIGKLRAAQIVLSKSTQDQVKQMQAAGDITGAQGVIIDALQQKYGGAAAQLAKDDPMGMLAKSAEDASTTLGTALLPTIQKLVDAITPLIDKMTAWINKHPELTKDIALLALGITGMTAAIGLLAVAWITMEAATLPIIGTIALIVVGIVALIAIVDLIVTKWTTIKDFFIKLWDDIKNAFGSAIDWIVGEFQKLEDIINTIITKIENIGSGIAKVANSVGGSVVSFVTGHLAQGGTASGGSTYLVGEHGPELFTPGTNGTVTPNNKIGMSGGGIVVNINGGNYLSQSAALDMGDKIVKALQRQSRGS